MTGEGVEGIIVMLVIVFAIFHMVKKKSRSGLEDFTRQHSESQAEKQEEKEI